MEKQAFLRAIRESKQKSGSVILAHTYQPPEILELADICGDSFALAQAATKEKSKRVIVCGVRFMAETVAMLAPEKEVFLAAPEASCPMAEQIEPTRVRQFKQENPAVPVVAYINTTALLKAECDVCVTSSSAVKIVSALPENRLLFIPDKNLGAYVQAKVPQKEFVLWEGSCPIHNALSEQQVIEAKRQYPHAKLAMHPECSPETLRHADMIGSTAAIIEFALQEKGAVILGTERGVADSLCLSHPHREFYALAPETLVCPDMKKTSPQMVLDCLNGTGGERIILEEALRKRARVCIERMLELGS